MVEKFQELCCFSVFLFPFNLASYPNQGSGKKKEEQIEESGGVASVVSEKITGSL